MSLASIPKAITLESNGDNKRTFGQKLKYVLSNITVEPLVFFAILPSVMNMLTTQNLSLEKACRVNLKFNESICDAMVRRDKTGYEIYQEEEVQKLVSKMVTIKMITTGSYPALLMIFLGSWSDRHNKRKPIIFMPVIGELISAICLFFCSYYFMELSVEYCMLAETIPIALGGTWACGFLGIYTYVSGLCNDNERTLRIGAVTMFQTIAWTLGIFSSGIIINALGFKGVYTITSILFSLSLLYGIIFIKESETVDVAENVKSKYSLTDFFSVKHVINTFKICFKKGKNNRRSKMFAIMFLSALIMGPHHGEVGVVYLYTRLKFGWNEVDFSLFNSVAAIVNIFGNFFALAVFAKYMGISDGMLGVIAMITKVCATLFYAFAPNAFIFYIGPFVEVFHGACHIALRSLMAKIVPPHELGQSNSIFAIFEAVTPLFFGSAYSTLYRATLEFFPGAFFLISGGVYTITIFLFLYMHIEIKKESLQQEKEVEQNKKLLQKS